MIWNNIYIPLSYKYDISYMMDDILNMLEYIQKNEVGEMSISWLPDTFRTDWRLKWDSNKINVVAKWENTMGDLERILNQKNSISISKSDFINEWKGILECVMDGLTSCGYDANIICDMKKLLEQYDLIDGFGILYNN